MDASNYNSHVQMTNGQCLCGIYNCNPSLRVKQKPSLFQNLNLDVLNYCSPLFFFTQLSEQAFYVSSVVLTEQRLWVQLHLDHEINQHTQDHLQEAFLHSPCIVSCATVILLSVLLSAEKMEKRAVPLYLLTTLNLGKMNWPVS